MANSGLSRPYALTDESIDSVILPKRIGAYALGYTGQDGSFYISYVGRSDFDVNKRLHEHIGESLQFKFGYFPTVKANYEKECQLYHDFPNTKNKVHPKKPEGQTWLTCPICGG